MIAKNGFMRALILAGTVVAIATMTFGCAHKYRNLGNDLRNISAKNATVEDVSLLLGFEPYECEDIPAVPFIGIEVEKSTWKPAIAAIHPTGPASSTGIKVGDIIKSVNSDAVYSSDEFMSITKGLLENPNQPIVIETLNDSYTLTPKYPAEYKECLWKDLGERVTRSRGFMHKEVTYQTSFTAGCTFIDGVAYGECWFFSAGF